MLFLLRSLACSLVALCCLSGSLAVTRRVPQEYPTIQAALDSLQDNDTILVAVGTYAEALRAPGRSNWVLRGDVVPDTGDYPRPIVDPSSLPRPDTVTCLMLSPLSHGIVIEDFVFRNGREMYDSLPRHYLGGVVNNSTDLTVRRCLFDSTYVGVSSDGGDLNLQDCRFEHNWVICAGSSVGAIHAVNCLFSCDGGFGYNAVARDHSTFLSCEFRDNTSGELLVVGAPTGDSTIIENCIFGPWSTWWSAVEVTVRSGCVLRRCVFTECDPGPSLVNVEMTCADAGFLPLILSDNVFMNCESTYPPYRAIITNFCQDFSQQSTFWGVIENNVFEDVRLGPPDPYANALYLYGRWLVRRNRFTRLDPPSAPDTYATSIEGGDVDTLELRDNLFDSDGLAAGAHQARMDARWNWWGDSTGPYHPILNPNGQGADVGDRVDFVPWHPDTSFLPVPRRHVPVPQQVSLEVYPNPFNATATVKLSVSRPGIFQVSLFNLLGQRVADLWSGAVAQEKRIQLNGAALPSGLYFVRVWQPIENRPVALEKAALIR